MIGLVRNVSYKLHRHLSWRMLFVYAKPNHVTYITQSIPTDYMLYIFVRNCKRKKYIRRIRSMSLIHGRLTDVHLRGYVS